MTFLQKFMPDNRWELAVIIFPLLVDGIDYYFFEDVNLFLISLVKNPSVLSVSIMLIIYFFFIVAISISELLVPDIRPRIIELTFTSRERSAMNSGPRRIKSTWPELLFFYPSMGFGIIMILLVVYSMGITDRTPLFTDNQQSAVIFTAVGLFFVHVTAMFWKPKPRFKSTQGWYLAVYAPAVVICALVINLSVAAWQYMMGDPGLQVQPAREGRVLDWFLAYPIFIFFFASPRFMFMNKNFTWISLLSALTLVGYFVWKSLDYVKIV